jgi:hypothetical protein
MVWFGLVWFGLFWFGLSRILVIGRIYFILESRGG